MFSVSDRTTRIENMIPLATLALVSLVMLVAAQNSYSASNDLIRGSKQRVQKVVTLPEGYNTIHIKGPIQFNLGLDEDPVFNDCQSLRIFIDDNLLDSISITLQGETLAINTRENIVPTKWISMTLHCNRIISAFADQFSNLGIYSIARDSFSVTAQDAYVSLSGKLNALTAVADRNAHVTLGMLALKKGAMTASNKGFIYVGSRHLENPKPSDLELKASGQGEIHLRF